MQHLPIERSCIRHQVLIAAALATGVSARAITPTTRLYHIGSIAGNALFSFVSLGSENDIYQIYMSKQGGSLAGRRSVDKIVDWVSDRLRQFDRMVIDDEIPPQSTI